MVLYFTEILDLKFSFFSILIKLKQCMFKKINWILTSPEGPTRNPARRYLTLEVYSALIEYENGKAKPANYLLQIIDCDDLNDKGQSWVHGNLVHLVTDPALSRAVGFFNFYHQCWALIEREKTLMHCGNTTSPMIMNSKIT